MSLVSASSEKINFHSPLDASKPLRIAMLYPWPGSIENGEFEIIRRLQYFFKETGVTFDLISNEGRLLDEDTNPVGSKMPIFDDYDFVLSCHYSSQKIIDSFHYHALWNPSEFFLHRFNNPVGLTQALANIFSSDDFIVSTSKSIIERLSPHARAFGNQMEGKFPKFFPASPDYGFKPTISADFKVFYCGINWDAHNVNASQDRWNRFSEMFSVLDKSEIMDFYGPTFVNGREPWAGFQSYRGQLPFDGISLIRAINQSGVGLALASDAHRECGGMLSSRAYEILAAGALLISDRNSFLEHWFGDSVLFIDFDPKDPIGVANQVIKYADWIKNNLEEAKAKATAAQDIWRQNFAFEATIPKLVEQHAQRVAELKARKCARNPAEQIDVLAVLDTDFQVSALDDIIVAFKEQDYPAKRLLIVCDPRNQAHCKVSAEQAALSETDYAVIALDTIQNTPKGPQRVPTGRLIQSALDQANGEYVAFLPPGVRWQKMHLSKMKRSLEDNPHHCLVYGGTMKIAPGCAHPVLSEDLASYAEIRKVGDYAFRGNLLIRKSYLEQIPSWLFAATDVVSELAILVPALIKKVAVFNRELTTYLMAGKDGIFHTPSEDVNWRHQAIFRETCRILGVDGQSYANFWRETEAGTMHQGIPVASSEAISASMIHDSVIAALKGIVASKRILRGLHRVYKRLS